MALVPDLSVVPVCQLHLVPSVFVNTCLFLRSFSNVHLMILNYLLSVFFFFFYIGKVTQWQEFVSFFAELSSVCVAGLFLRVQEFTGFSGSARSIGPLQPFYLFCCFFMASFLVVSDCGILEKTN